MWPQQIIIQWHYIFLDNVDNRKRYIGSLIRYVQAELFSPG